MGTRGQKQALLSVDLACKHGTESRFPQSRVRL